jgi:hypothetical protein
VKVTPDNRFDVHPIDSSHLRFQLRPDEPAKVLDGLTDAGR